MPANDPEHHPAFKIPSNRTIKIWRYMNFTKFVAFLEHRALWFSRTSCLPDPYEGSYSRANKAWREAVAAEAALPDLARKRFLDSQTDSTLSMRKWLLVNSWHMNDHESEAMWKLYTRSSDALCIQSTYQGLRTALDQNIYIGEIQYIDYEMDLMPQGYVFFPVLNKRKSFEHERELRAVIWEIPRSDTGGIDLQATPNDRGRWIEVQLDDLVENVFIAPSAAPWFADLVKRVATRYGLGKEVRQSILDREPFF